MSETYTEDEVLLSIELANKITSVIQKVLQDNGENHNSQDLRSIAFMGLRIAAGSFIIASAQKDKRVDALDYLHTQIASDLKAYENDISNAH